MFARDCRGRGGRAAGERRCRRGVSRAAPRREARPWRPAARRGARRLVDHLGEEDAQTGELGTRVLLARVVPPLVLPQGTRTGPARSIGSTAGPRARHRRSHRRGTSPYATTNPTRPRRPREGQSSRPPRRSRNWPPERAALIHHILATSGSRPTRDQQVDDRALRVLAPADAERADRHAWDDAVAERTTPGTVAQRRWQAGRHLPSRSRKHSP
jgi:hypothetical protein